MYITVRSSPIEAGKEYDDFLYSLLKLPVLEEVALNCEMPACRSKTLQEHGVYWMRRRYKFD